MVLRKITVDKSVRYIPMSAKIKDKENKLKTIQSGSLPRKQNKKISQNSKKFLKNEEASGFGKLTKEYLYNYKII